MSMKFDYSILKKLPLKDQPIAVKYCCYEPEGIPALEQEYEGSLCEIMRKAQLENRVFYFSRKNTETCAGKGLLGMEAPNAGALNGLEGVRLGMFDSPRANLRTSRFLPVMKPGTVNYVIFSTLEKMTFDPDVMVFSATPDVAEMVMRAYSYSDGEPYCSTCTPIAGCAWTLIYPYLFNKINFVVPSLVHGMHGRQIYPTDTMLISVPYNCLPQMLENLKYMDLHLSGHVSKQAYYDELDQITKYLEELHAVEIIKQNELEKK